MQICTRDVVNSVSLDQAPMAVSAGTLIVSPDLFAAQIGAPFIRTGKVGRRTSFGWRYTSPPRTLRSRSWEAYLPSPGSSAFARSAPGCDSHLLSFLFLTLCSDLCPTLGRVLHSGISPALFPTTISFLQSRVKLEVLWNRRKCHISFFQGHVALKKVKHSWLNCLCSHWVALKLTVLKIKLPLILFPCHSYFTFIHYLAVFAFIVVHGCKLDLCLKEERPAESYFGFYLSLPLFTM